MRILITAGPTREFLDQVRFISNPSTGRMGYAIAEEAARRGHAVTLVSGPVEVQPPAGVELRRVVSALEMLAECERVFDAADCAIMCAAVCDYRPVTRAAKKLPKATTRITLELEPTPDICACLGAKKAGRVVIGFALEDHDHQAHAEAKLVRKRCDAIVLNDLVAVGAEMSEIRILRERGGWGEPIRGTKTALACEIIKLAEELVG